MAKYSTENIRNIALVGHSGAGKTSLAEALLHAAGTISSKGSVDRGTTVCDFDPQEKALKHTISPSICHFEHRGRQINVIDTPGYIDLLGRTTNESSGVQSASQVDAGERRVAFQTLQQVVGLSVFFDLSSGFLTVNTYLFVKFLSVAAGLNTGHQNFFGGHER